MNQNPNYTVNTDIRLYWDFESSYDNVNNVELLSLGATSNYGRCNTSGILRNATSAVNYRTGTTDVSPPASSFSTVVWFSTHDDQQNSGCYILNKYEAGTTTTLDNSKAAFRSTLQRSYGVDAVSGYYRVDHILEGAGLSTPVVQQFVESSKWNMYYAGVDGTMIECSVNGLPKASGYSSLFISSGNYLFNFEEGVVDEIRTYDRTLTQDELSYLYNWGFPQPIHKERPKTQFLYPSKTMGGPNISSGHYIIPNTDTFWGNLASRSGLEGDAFRYYQDELRRSTSSQTVHYSSTFSPINQWHTTFSGQTPDDFEAITMADGSGIFRFETGPCFVEPSAIVLHFKGASFPRRNQGYPTQESNAHNGLIPHNRGYVNSIRFTDASGTDIANIPSNHGFVLGYSGDYGGESYIHYSSGVELNSLDGLYLNNTYLHFTLTTSGEYVGGELSPGMAPGNKTPYPVLFGAAVELNGANNIAETGVGIEAYLDMYTISIDTVNSGVDLYTTAHEAQNSGVDLYMWGYAVENSSIPFYTQAVDFVNNGIDLYTFGHGVENSGNTLFVGGLDSVNSGIDLYINGHVPINSGIDLYINGVEQNSVEQNSGSMPLFLKADVYNSSNSLTFYMNSTTDPSIYTTRPFYLGVSDNATDKGSVPLYLNTATTGEVLSYVPFYLKSETPSLDKGTDLFLANTYQSGERSKFLFIRGLGTLNGGLVDNGSVPLFLERVEGVEHGVSMYLGVNSGDSQGVNMYTVGGTWTNSGISLTVPSTIDTKNSGLNIFVNGF
jgi:hypothetical protein